MRRPLQVFRAPRVPRRPRARRAADRPDPDLGAQLQPVAARHRTSSRDGRRSAARTRRGLWTAGTRSSADCVQTSSAGVKAKPLIIAAAEGGGIRAAAWTARVFEELQATGPCGAEAVLLSSGASGGSVGLSLFRDSKPGQAFARAESIAQSPALTAGVSGLMVGDVVAGSTGCRSHRRVSRQRRVDLAGPCCAHPVGVGSGRARVRRHDAAAAGAVRPHRPIAHRVARAQRHGCGLRLPGADQPTRPRHPESDHARADGGTAIPNCKGDQPGVANVIDLEQLYGDCPLDMDWATAAMTSARFPIITPAGRTSAPGVAACDNLPDLQLADGGIAENSGLGTLSDIAPELAHLVAEKNANADGVSVPIIVPIVLYISNAPGRDVTAATAGFSSESASPSPRAHPRRPRTAIGRGCSASRARCRTRVRRPGASWMRDSPPPARACRPRSGRRSETVSR